MPVIVVCPARCGSTTVTEYLRDKGVNMGERFRPAGWHENGGFEDMDFAIPNQCLISGFFTVRQWKLLIEDAISQRKEPWGVKDPRISALITSYKLFFPTALWIRLRRDIQDMAESIVKVAGWSEKNARIFVKRRTALLNKHLPGVPEIPFSAIKDGSYKGIIDDLLIDYYGGSYGSLDETRRARGDEGTRKEAPRTEQAGRLEGNDEGRGRTIPFPARQAGA